MNRILLFCALGALLGCRPTAEPSGGVITLSYVASEQSKTDALTAGDEVAVFARVEGTERYFLECEKFVTGSDGRTLSTSPAVYYPETKQAVHFYAYIPYHTGAFSVPSDQSTPAALKQADLCWATAQSTPVTVVPLEFRHLFARLVVTTNEPTAKIACSVVLSGVLNAATAEFSLNSTKSEVFTSGNELILPAQPLSRLILTVSGVDYLFDTPITLESGKTTSLSFTLNASTRTATLAGSSTSDWTASTQQGNPTQAVSNVLALHWPNVPSAQASTVNKIVLTINGADYTVSSGIAYDHQTFTIPFASDKLKYPYQITQIRSYANTQEVLPVANVLRGSTIYKSGLSTLGIVRNPITPPLPSDYIKIGNLYWAKGNLVATSSTASNMNGCAVGKPEDVGLFFQFGSLIGWRSGASGSGGTGVGFNFKGGFWSGVSFVWANEAIVWPTTMMNTPTSWPNNTTNQWYFSVQSGWSTINQDIRDYPNLAIGGLADIGVGDACTYYLGDSWRLPTRSEYQTLLGAGQTGQTAYNGSSGRWIGPSAGNASTSLFFPYTGGRYNGPMSSDYYRLGYYATSIIESGTTIYCAGHGDVYVFAANGGSARTSGIGVRCVSVAP